MMAIAAASNSERNSGRNEVSIVNQCRYLGIIFFSCGFFIKAINALTDKAKPEGLFQTEATRSTKRCAPNDKTIRYACYANIVLQQWNMSTLCHEKDVRHHICDKQLYEKLNVKLCKYILGVGKHATNAAVLGELGRYPMTLKFLTQGIKFWDRIRSENVTGLANTMESKRDSMGHLGTHLVSVGLKGAKMDSFWVAIFCSG